MSARVSLHPLLIALMPILFLYQHNIVQLVPRVLWAPAGVTLAALALAWFPLRRLAPDRRKAALILSLAIVLFFGYGPAVKLAEAGWIALTGWGTDLRASLALAWLGLLAWGGRHVWTTRRDLRPLTQLLNVASLTVIAISLSSIAAYELTARPPADSELNRLRRSDTEQAAQAPTARPRDVYYIVVDRYASAGTLRRAFGFDNEPFLGFLEERGFYVARESRANYPKTFQSLASALNMRHLTGLAPEVGPDRDDQTVVYEMLQDYRVWRILKAHGYRFVHLGSWWEPTHRNPHADVNLNHRALPLSSFSRTLLENSAVSLFLGLGPEPLDFASEQRQRVRYKFEQLAALAGSDGPTFAFAHFLIPHSPFVFDRNCEPLDEPAEPIERTLEDNQRAYLGQLRCLNRLLEALIAELLARSDPQPIIILQADEGPCESLPGFRKTCGEGLRWTELDDETLRNHLEILNAYYLPGVDAEEVLYPSITPVNSFRTVFNLYFGAGYAPLPDRSHIFPDLGAPYQFIDVTERIAD